MIYKKVLIKTFKSLRSFFPIIIWVVLLVSILKESNIFLRFVDNFQNNFLWVLFFNFFWSISVWNVLNSYVIANSFGNLADNILIVTVFLVSWVSVWIIQIPIESYFFWKKFAIIRNLVSFLFAILISYLIYYLYLILWF